MVKPIFIACEIRRFFFHHYFLSFLGRDVNDAVTWTWFLDHWSVVCSCWRCGKASIWWPSSRQVGICWYDWRWSCRKIRFGPDLWQLRLQFLGGGAWWCYIIDLYIYICVVECQKTVGQNMFKMAQLNIRNTLRIQPRIEQHRGVADWDALAGFGILSTGWPLGSGVCGVPGAVQVCKH